MNRKRRGIVLVVMLIFLLFAVTPAGAFCAENANSMRTSVARQSAKPYVVDNGGHPMSVLALLGQVPLETDQTARVVRDGVPVDLTTHAATGQTLQIRDENDALISESPIVLTGDVLGTGEAGLNQLIRLVEAACGESPLEGIWAQAADMSRSGAMDLADVVTAAVRLRAVQEQRDYDISSKTVPLYFRSQSDKRDTSVYFIDGQTDIPYVPLELALKLLPGALEADDPGFTLRTMVDGSVTRATRENGAMIEIDAVNDTIAYTDVDWFYAFSYAATCLDVLTGSGIGDNGESKYFKRQPGSFERNGHPVLIDLSDYGIDIVYQNGTTYVPLQTVSDILFGFANDAPILYNGDMIAVLDYGDREALTDLMYGAPLGTRSTELAEFAYNELCLTLDIFYGLKDEHNIDSFRDLFEQTGLDRKLRSSDPLEANNAVEELVLGYLGDLHSILVSPSYLCGKDADPHTGNLAPSVIDTYVTDAVYSGVREQMMPDGVPGYQEVGNTAFVTFDEFTLPTIDYYNTPPGADATDTIGLIMYAHSQIMREGSPIENVVVDLSNNVGGDSNAALYLASWFLGGTCAISVNDTYSGAQASNRYAIDANADHTFDENDTLLSKRLYCLIGSPSFSCANLVPAVFKESGLVTLVGHKTGGGTCFVHPISMADGTLLQVSGNWCMSNVSNGSYYDIDRGIEPDISLTKIRSFYNREALATYLSGLMR